MNKPLFPQLFKGIALLTPGGDLIYCIDSNKQSHWHMHLCAALQEMLGLPEPPHFLVPGYTATIDRWLDPQTLQIWTSAEIYRPVQHHQALLNAVFGTDNLVWNVAPWQEGSCDPMILETYRHQFPQIWEDHDLVVRFERPEQFSKSYSFNEGYYSVQEPLQGIGTPTRQEELSVEKAYLVGTLTPGLNCTPSSLDASASRYGNSAATLTENANRRVGFYCTVREGLHPTQTENVSSGGTAALTESEYAENPNAIANTEGFAKEDSADSHDDSEQMDVHSRPPHAQGYVLRLFISGNSAATEQTLMSLHQLLEQALRHPYTLKVIDIFNHPDQAEANQISATPTLLRVWPQPVRRIVGDFNDLEKVLRILAAPEE